MRTIYWFTAALSKALQGYNKSQMLNNLTKLETIYSPPSEGKLKNDSSQMVWNSGKTTRYK